MLHASPPSQIRTGSNDLTTFAASPFYFQGLGVLRDLFSLSKAIVVHHGLPPYAVSVCWGEALVIRARMLYSFVSEDSRARAAHSAVGCSKEQWPG